ncbi:MAG: carbon storage regulator [Pirellulaceae bacterium]|nr:carbon storage regulator [Pirellulaceae bacterium]
MLVLSRRENESIVVGRTITIKVVGIRGNKVRLAIDAPQEVPVDRAEVRERMEREGWLAERAVEALVESNGPMNPVISFVI